MAKLEFLRQLKWRASDRGKPSTLAALSGEMCLQVEDLFVTRPAVGWQSSWVADNMQKGLRVLAKLQINYSNASIVPQDGTEGVSAPLVLFFFPFHPRTVTEIECSSSALLYIAEKVSASGVYLQAPWAEQKKATWILPFQLSTSKITHPPWFLNKLQICYPPQMWSLLSSAN